MSATNFTSAILVDQTSGEVFNAINNVRGWWSEEIEGSTDKLNDEWTYHYEDVHRSKMKIIEFVPGKKVVWLVMDNYFSFTKDKSEWTGNKIIFEITEKDNKTQLQFTQLGLVPEYECYDICENAWSTYIQKSLRNLITTGKGQPNVKSKTQTDFTTTITVSKTPEEVFDSIKDVSKWWSKDFEGSSTKLNDEFVICHPGAHFSKQKLIEVIPGKKIIWFVTDSELDWLEKDKHEWTNTKMIFDITPNADKTVLHFTHEGLVPEKECYARCEQGWNMVIKERLFNFITDGKAI